MRQYDCLARITAYVDGQAVKSKVVTNPLVYTTNDRLISVRSYGTINATLFSFYASHNSSEFGKELEVLRALTNMSYIKPCNARNNKKYRNILSLIGLEDFESFLDKEGDNCLLYLDIAIHTTEGERKRQKVLTNISFRVLSTNPTNTVKLKALTDWFRLEPKEQNDNPVNNNVLLSNIDKKPIGKSSVTSDKIEDIKDNTSVESGRDKECLYREVASVLYALSTYTKDWVKDDYCHTIKDVIVFSRCVDAIYNFTRSTRPCTQLTELEEHIIALNNLFNEFLYAIEHKDVLDKNLIKLLGKTCETINIRQISDKLHDKAFKLSKQ